MPWTSAFTIQKTLFCDDLVLVWRKRYSDWLLSASYSVGIYISIFFFTEVEPFQIRLSIHITLTTCLVAWCGNPIYWAVQIFSISLIFNWKKKQILSLVFIWPSSNFWSCGKWNYHFFLFKHNFNCDEYKFEIYYYFFSVHWQDWMNVQWKVFPVVQAK